jgi:hypothetical protein
MLAESVTMIVAPGEAMMVGALGVGLAAALVGITAPGVAPVTALIGVALAAMTNRGSPAPAMTAASTAA